MTTLAVIGLLAGLASALAAYYRYRSLKLPKDIEDEAKKTRDARHRQIDSWLGHGRPPAGGMRDNN